jgi:hypothetical protein
MKTMQDPPYYEILVSLNTEEGLDLDSPEELFTVGVAWKSKPDVQGTFTLFLDSYLPPNALCSQLLLFSPLKSLETQEKTHV